MCYKKCQKRNYMLSLVKVQWYNSDIFAITGTFHNKSDNAWCFMPQSTVYCVYEISGEIK